MGGLGNGRRGGRSPPLMIGALIACILVLGFNYWVSSSRNLELQTKLYELEGQLRRGAAERGVAENKRNEYQEEIQRQREQMSHLESMYKRQLEGAQNICNQERVPLQQNISSSTKTIQDLKGQLNQLNDFLGKLQKELQSCQGNINTLNNKLTYDMTHCHSQVLAQKEMCDERVAAAKVEVQKKMEKLISPQAGQAANGEVKEELVTGSNVVNTSATESHTPLVSQPKGDETSELLTNNILPDNDAAAQQPPSKVLPQKEIHPVPSNKSVTHVPEANQPVKSREGKAETNKVSTKNLTDIQVMDANEEGIQTEEADPGMEGMLVDQGKDDPPVGLKLDDADDYDQDLQVTDGVDIDKQLQTKQAENTDKGMEEELADYNGDDENEGEFEADKQAELAQI